MVMIKQLTRNKKNLYKYTLLVIIGLIVIFPILWAIRTSLAPRFDNKFIPSKLTLEHYISLFGREEFLLYLKNSFFVSMGSIFITLSISLFGGYALSRFTFPGKNLSILLLLFPLLPPIAILVPLITYMNKIGLYNTLWAVITANVVFNLPLTVWMFRNFILANPVEIEEAAFIDGCSKVGVLFKIAIPTMLPGIIAISIFVFINSWNNYLYAFALTSSQNLRVLPQGILAFLGSWGTYWGGLTASGIMAVFPPVLLFLIFQKWFISGIFAQHLK